LIVNAKRSEHRDSQSRPSRFEPDHDHQFTYREQPGEALSYNTCMPSPDPIKRASHKREWKRRNPGKMPYDGRHREEVRRIILRRKDAPCRDCGIRYPPYVMQFDHRDPTLKLATPALIARKGWSFERTNQELDKCDVVCANCHAERTYRQRTLGLLVRSQPFQG
jgi:hypothetical protein